MKVINNPKCRKCSHYHYWELMSSEVQECTFISCSCKAKDWIPTDNLEYLEYLYNKKAKV